MERAVFVYTTWPSVVEAEKAGRAVVEAGLAACVNILPGMISHYRWQGAVERAEEAVMIVKTRASLAERVRAAIKDTHPYDTPGHSGAAHRERRPHVSAMADGRNRASGTGVSVAPRTRPAATAAAPVEGPAAGA